MPPSTVLLAGGRPAAIAFSATALQCTTALAVVSADVAAGWATATSGASVKEASSPTATLECVFMCVLSWCGDRLVAGQQELHGMDADHQSPEGGKRLSSR